MSPTLPSRRIGSMLLALGTAVSCTLPPTLTGLAPGFKPDQQATAPRLDGFGQTSLQVDGIEPAARPLFAQGMAQAYGFNSEEAIRAFKAALAKDPGCAMCAWGVAYQMGPNINAVQRGDLREAVQYVDYALSHGKNLPARERALIDALALRYGHNSTQREAAVFKAAICGSGSTDLADPLDIAYAARMEQLVERYPDDPDLLTLYAEAEMIATRGHFWDKTSGKPTGRIGELGKRIEALLQRHPEHIGLNHYAIHTFDAPPVASRALAAADRLWQLAPQSPHLLHMPSHIFVQVGRYADATRVNQLAVSADETLAAELARQNFSPTRDWRFHNRHFQWYAALMEGRTQLALATARAAASHAGGDHEYFEYLRSLPLLTLLHTGRWQMLEQEPLPTGQKGMAGVLGEMAHGIALAQLGKTGAARAALARMEPAATTLAQQHTGNSPIDKTVHSLINSARLQLEAELAWAERRTEAALAKQAQAVEAALAANNNEPPMLAGLTRLRLGRMQLQAGQAAAAETSFRTSLTEHPASGWALQGLLQALQVQGKTESIPTIQNELARAFARADIALDATGK